MLNIRFGTRLVCSVVFGFTAGILTESGLVGGLVSVGVSTFLFYLEVINASD